MIELSELVFFDYGLSDNQDGLRCLRNGIYTLWITSSPCEPHKHHFSSCGTSVAAVDAIFDYNRFLISLLSHACFTVNP